MLFSVLYLVSLLITPGELFPEQGALQLLAKPVHPIEQWVTDCTVNDYSTQGMLHCYQQAYDKWDAELNSAYRELRQQLTPAGRKVLLQAQRRWLAYRDAEFELVQHLYSTLEGTMWQLIIAVSRVEIVRQRTLELTDYLETLQFEQLSD